VEKNRKLPLYNPISEMVFMMKRTDKDLKKIILSLSMLAMAACTLTGFVGQEPGRTEITPPAPANTEAPTALPTETNIPNTATPEALSIPVLITKEIQEEGDLPVQYILEIAYPFLENGGEKGEVFNDAVQSEIDTQIDAFKQSLADFEGETMPGPAGLYITYTVTNSAHNLISVKFDASVYTGGAHPYPYSLVYNFELATGRPLALGDLFEPGSDYLQKISEYCVAELQTREWVFPDFEQYIQPAAETFPSWNLQEDSLLITFDVYLVAPYAAGPQRIEVPYEALKDQIGEQSPLKAFMD